MGREVSVGDGIVRRVSRTVAGGALAAGLLLVQGPGPGIEAARAAESCKKPLSVVGPSVPGERAAMRAATAAWQREARRLHGARFADWWYSGDRVIACTWDMRGVVYRCRATALPCG